MAYDELARYVGARIDAALADPDISAGEQDQLRRAAHAARHWARRRGSATQCWVEVTARSPTTVAATALI